MKNLINWELRDQWTQEKWKFMEEVQEQEPHLWMGWHDLLTVAPVSPTGELYVP